MKLTFNEWLIKLTQTCKPKEPYYHQVINGDTITFSFNPKFGK